MKLFALTLLGLLAALPLHAEEPQASEASIREFLAVTESQKMLDGMLSQLDSLMQAGMKQALAGQTLNADQQKILNDMRTKMVALFKAEMAWSTFEPMIVGIYQKSFTEPEVKGMLQFYKSPAGKAVIAKMPTVIQSSMQAAQSRMGSFMPKLKQLQEDTVARLKATSSK
jgi:hypothetical protein